MTSQFTLEMRSTKLVSKIKKYTIEHPTFVTIGPSLAVTFAIGGSNSDIGHSTSICKILPQLRAMSHTILQLMV